MKEYLESLSIIVASLTAIYGITAWRREMRGKREYELAEEVLALFYEARDKIRYIRSPMGRVGEGETREAGPDETPEEKRILDQAYVVFERYEKNQQAFNRLHALRYRFMALFGPGREKPFDDLRGILNEIFSASRMWATQSKRLRAAAPKQIEKIAETINRYESVFWEGMEDDPIAPKLERAIKDAEGICRKVLQSRPSWLSRLKRRVSNRWLRRTSVPAGGSSNAG